MHAERYDRYWLMGRGILTGQLKSLDNIPDKDIQKILPRFKQGNLEISTMLVKEPGKVAEKKACTLGHLALGWVRSLSKRKEML